MRAALVGALAVLALAARPANAQQPLTGLEFFGFRTGAHLQEIAVRLAELGAGPLRCERAQADPRVLDCRAHLPGPALGGPVELWASAIDSVAGVVTLSGDVSAVQLDRWRERLERYYGQVDARVQGPQWMLQWVWRGRMIRLTWRIQQGEKTASVSLVDGRVLDRWGGAGPGERDPHPMPGRPTRRAM